MDIWEANSRATVMTPHTCSGEGLFLCNTPEECARNTGVCDKNGCGVNPFAQGARTFYGPGRTVDTSRPFTVLTQFFSADNTSSGELAEIRRTYFQDGRAVTQAMVMNETVDALETGVGAVTQDFCIGKNATDFLRLGGLDGMGASLTRGMVLIFSFWNSPGDFMEWLDQGNAGPCGPTEGDPVNIMKNNSDASVIFSNIRWGEIGSTTRFMPNGTVVAALAPLSQGTTRYPETVAWLAVAATVFGYLLM
jgi:cellulase